MVNWTELCTAIAANSHRNENVYEITVRNWKSFPVERFPILVGTVKPKTPVSTPTLKAVMQPPKLVIQELDLELDNTTPQFVAKTAHPSSKPIASLKAVKQSESTEMPVAPVVPVKRRELHHKPIDPIVIGIEQSEPLYNGSSNQSKRQIECEEAQRIEAKINDLYKSQGGRSRGWTKVGLENFIRPRCASGGDIYELDRAKKAFVWQLLLSDKVISAVFDFICVAKNIRVAVWFESEKIVIVYPAADHNGPTDGSESPTIYHVTSDGNYRTGMKNAKDLVNFCKRMEYILMPPYSVGHSLAGLTLEDLESVGKKLGMAEVTGTKAERVAKLASYKLQQRLLVADATL